MSVVANYPHITIGTDGKPRVADTRFKVVHLAAEHFYYGWSAEELMRQHPDLRPEEVYSALTFFYDHYDHMIREMETTADRVEAMRAAQPFSRSELLERAGGK